ncbi:hypothetical protein N7532_011818 [Penicillium argentinense]|uniref:Piwi domain-containing protein n=1 Tax=Penicillium argentinense TaxID=1131581 RepID=A0A9W9EJB4_9EURO|nr:uncharacterized protein N7532_011818 [Penicillium argentinense]KAJ5082775.1 hypothetical protein N7532_011818 [Penicillium argentinense]
MHKPYILVKSELAETPMKNLDLQNKRDKRRRRPCRTNLFPYTDSHSHSQFDQSSCLLEDPAHGDDVTPKARDITARPAALAPAALILTDHEARTAPAQANGPQDTGALVASLDDPMAALPGSPSDPALLVNRRDSAQALLDSLSDLAPLGPNDSVLPGSLSVAGSNRCLTGLVVQADLLGEVAKVRQTPSGEPRRRNKSNVMFTSDTPDEGIALFEDKCLNSKQDIKQEAQLDFRDQDVKEKNPLPPVRLPIRRPIYGMKGKKINLRANFFPIRFGPSAVFYAYKVIFEQPPNTKRHVIQVFTSLVKNPEFARFGPPVSDLATWFVTTRKLDIQAKRVGVDPGDDGVPKHVYTVRFKLQGDGRLPLEAVTRGLSNPDVHMKVSNEDFVIQMLNIIVSGYAFNDPGVAITDKSRSKYFYIDDRAEKWNLGGGLECLRGIFSSVRPGPSKFMLNLNVSNSAFYQPLPMDEFYNEFLRMRNEDYDALHRTLRNVKVTVKHLKPLKDDNGNPVPRVKNIWGLATTKDGAPIKDDQQGRLTAKVPSLAADPYDVEFWCQAKDDRGNPTGPGWYISVAKYFKEQYNITARKGLPVLNVGNTARPIYMPMDVCRIIKGQQYNGDLSTAQRQEIIKFSCRRPPDNHETIMNLGRDILGIPTKKFRNEKQMDFADTMAVVPGRILDPPTLKYATRPEAPRNGSWNLVGKKFLKGASIESWVCVWIKAGGTRQKPEEITTGLGEFRAKAGEMGLVLRGIPAIVSFNLDGRDLFTEHQALFKLLDGVHKQSKRPDFALIVIPQGADRVFRYVKWQCDVRIGLANHCVLANKFTRTDAQYMANNALKVNLKFGGINHTLDTNSSGLLAAGKTMVVGIDATHPAPTDTDNFPTIAAIVASTDGGLGQWPGEIRIQSRRQEMMEHLTDMMLKRLHRWTLGGKKPLPDNILIYRDGVSEGQYNQVLVTEMTALRGAFAKVYKDRSHPRLTILVVTKRHHVRFFPTSAQDCDRTNNCKNGTLVERGITRPWYWDFYLQAQTPLQGSARPAHYVVLYDEIFTKNPSSPKGYNAADALQQLTHNICYMMARCTRAISYGTPAFLADRYCDRGRKYVLAYYEEREAMLKKSGKKKVNKSDIPVPEPHYIEVHHTLAETMVYI